jgi:glycosyltransferase involved in cell wall biosynthesis
MERLLWRLTNLQQKYRLLNFRKFSEEQARVEVDARHLIGIAHKIDADVVWLGYGNISYPLLRYIKGHSNLKTVVDTDSVWSRFILRGLPYAATDEDRARIAREGAEKAAEEKWATNIADVTTAVSEIDASYYRQFARSPDQIHLFANVIDPDLYKLPPARTDAIHKPCIYLAGTFWRNSPMEDAARWTIKEILPLLRQQIPDIHLYILGNQSDLILNDIVDTHISITGQVDSVLPYLYHVDVAIVPLRFESGTRFKILEAGASGIPVVSTTLGAEGIPISNGKEILIADEPQAFANAILRIINDKMFAMQIANNLRVLVETQYSLATLTEQGQRILEYVLAGPGSPSQD